MIVVDTSALVAILFRETDARVFVDKLVDRTASIGAPTVLEFTMVAEGRGGVPMRERAEQLVEKLPLDIVAWNVGHLQLAQQAFTRFGKGFHPAKLNFGDCMSYALAKSLDAPLLYKGEDFALTDIRSAVVR